MMGFHHFPSWFSVCHLRYWGQGVTGLRYVGGGYVWLPWGSGQLHYDPPHPGGRLRGTAVFSFCMGL